MKTCIKILQMIFTACGAWIGYFLGGFDGLLYALVIFVVCDYITGVMCAIIDKKLNSETGAKGIIKKVVIFLLVGIGNILDINVIKEGSAIRTAVIFFELSNEGISIIENAAKIGVPIPEKLQAVLLQLKDENNPEK